MNLEQRFWTKVDKEPDCWLWTASRTEKGYGRIGVPGSRYGYILAHRISWLLHVGFIPKGMMILHRCDNPPCVNPDHLFLGTQKDNMSDCREKGRHGNTILTDAQALTIRERFAAGETYAALAKEFGVSKSAIAVVVTARWWKHVGGPIHQPRKRP